MTLRTRISSAASWVALGVVAVLLGIGLLALVHRVETLDGALEESRSDRSALHSELNEQESASQALAEQVKRLGGKPVVEPDEPAPPLVIGLTDEQADAAVAEFCSVGDRCRPTVSRDDVREALADICDGGACDAPPAKDGKDGRDGADSTVPGPGLTDEQADAAVARYCAANDCLPEDGKDGRDGQDGKDGAPGSVTPGEYACPEGEYVTKISVTAEGSMVLACAKPSLLGQP